MSDAEGQVTEGVQHAAGLEIDPEAELATWLEEIRDSERRAERATAGIRLN